MTVSELIAILQQHCDPKDRVLLNGNCDDIASICQHRGSHRVNICVESDYVPAENLAPGWVYIYTE